MSKKAQKSEGYPWRRPEVQSCVGPACCCKKASFSSRSSSSVGLHDAVRPALCIPPVSSAWGLQLKRCGPCLDVSRGSVESLTVRVEPHAARLVFSLGWCADWEGCVEPESALVLTLSTRLVLSPSSDVCLLLRLLRALC